MSPETECGRVPPAAWMTTPRGFVRFLLSFRIHVLKRIAGQKWRSFLPDIHVVADVLRGYRVAAQDHQALDYVAQFTDVSCPAFLLEHLDGFR